MAIILKLIKLKISGNIIFVALSINLIIEFLFWMISLIIQKFENVKESFPIPKSFVIALIVISSSLVCLEIITLSNDNPDALLPEISFICMTASLFLMIYLYDSLSRILMEKSETEREKSEKEYYQSQAALQEEKSKELRRYRHDMRNRLTVIQQLVKEKKYDAVLEYIGIIEDKLSQTLTYSNTGNINLDSLINFKLSEASKLNISIESNIILPKDAIIDKDDMIVILGNLLDNAIEAVTDIKSPSKKYIFIDLRYDKGNLFICVKNTYNKKPHYKGNRLISCKKDKTLHGIGLDSVMSVVQKYDGLLDISVDENYFTADILLYLAKKKGLSH